MLACGRVPADEPLPTKVLVAEDQPAMRRLVAGVLRDAGYDVVEVGDGAMLWEELHAALRDDDNPTEVSLVVSDVRMPNVTGLEALARMREGRSACPVILMTAFSDASSVAEAGRLGAARVFSKPFDLRELVREATRLAPPR